MLVAGYGSRKLTIAIAAFVIVFFILYTYINPSWGYNYVAPAKPPIDGEGHSTNPAAKRPGGAYLHTAPSPGDADDRDGKAIASPRSRISPQFQQHLSWNPPIEIKKHYPPYGDYVHRDFDPNRWEIFAQNNAIYTNSTLHKLKPRQTGASAYDPYPAYNSDQWRKQWRGTHVPCNGPGGRPLDKSSDEVVRAYKGLPEGFPSANCGSFEAVGLDGDVCFDRYSRLGPYGVTKNDGGRPSRPNANWMKLQNECLELNKDRYQSSSPPYMAPGPGDEIYSKMQEPKEQPVSSNSPQSYKPRTAILIRTWDTYKYEENDIQTIRSLITELNLLSGGEYHVFLFVNIKDPSIPVFTERKAYEEKLAEFVPEELRDIAILWTEAVGYSWYNSVGEWSVYFQQFMPVQWFSQTHPEFEYIWNWEMDARYIGQHYHFLEQITKFARNQPRKYLWERNARYYFPSVHGSYDDFVKDTNRIVAESPHVKSVWGPQKWKPEQEVMGPEPPTTEQQDDFSWGVGEEADFITLLPIWDPRETLWSYRDKLWGYPSVNESDQPYLHVPRRTFINTLVRVSKNLLEAMHRENLGGLSMASEMWPSSTALQHGFKAVYAPHPIWFAHHWPPDYLENVINADGWGAGSGTGDVDNGRGAAYDKQRELGGLGQQGTGPNGEGKLGRWTQEKDSPYNPDREHNFAGWSWYFWSDFPRVLYWRWLGWKASFDIVTIEGRQSNDEFQNINWFAWEGEHGRMCLPGMLLHPVKEVEAPKGTKVSTAD